jgi:hypothetical protein
VHEWLIDALSQFFLVPRPNPLANKTCWICGEKGHIDRTCPNYLPTSSFGDGYEDEEEYEDEDNYEDEYMNQSIWQWRGVWMGAWGWILSLETRGDKQYHW